MITAEEAERTAKAAALKHYGLREPQFLGICTHCRLEQRGGTSGVTVYETLVSIQRKGLLGGYGPTSYLDLHIDIHPETGAVVGVFPPRRSPRP